MWTMPPDLLSKMGEHFQKGGNVMPPLLFISIVMWLLILRVGWQLLFVRRTRSLEHCLVAAEQGKFKGAGWQRQLLKTFLKRRSRSNAINHRLIDGLMLTFRDRTRKYIDTVLVLAAVAPLLGLLGTVMGMVATFDTIGKFGTGNARALAAGISEALITTQTGLIISIPGLLIGTLLKRKLDGLEDAIRRFGLGIVNHFNRIAPKAQGSSELKGNDTEVKTPTAEPPALMDSKTEEDEQPEAGPEGNGIETEAQETDPPVELKAEADEQPDHELETEQEKETES